MSEVSNPLFNNERDFLERQKEEYKKALMGDVDSIKAQGQDIGKKVAMAGGVLLAGYLVKRLVSGGGKKKAKKLKRTREEDPAGILVMPAIEDFDYSTGKQGKAASKKKSKNRGGSKVAQVIASQAATLLMMYLAKKVSEHLNSISENHDIAEARATATDTVTTEDIVTEENAI